MDQNLSVTIVLPIFAIVFGWVAWVISVNIRRSRANKQITELHARLLDRFAASQELIAFLDGESGRRYFDALQEETKDPFGRILNGVQLGVVIALLGISLLAVRAGQADPNLRNALLLIGAPATAIGAGFLIASALSHRLCRQWGLLENPRRPAA